MSCCWKLVARRVSDRRVLKLIAQWLRTGVSEAGMVRPTEAGVAQGGVISPLLANVYLHGVDALLVAEAAHLGPLVRYADDLVVLCASEAEAQAAHAWLVATLARLKLACHPAKTRVVGLSDGSAGFDFLGFHFRRTPMVRRPARRATKTWPSQRAKASIRAKVKAVTAPRSRLHLPVEEIVAELNPILRGWGAYFRRAGNARQMSEDRPLREAPRGPVRQQEAAASRGFPLATLPRPPLVAGPGPVRAVCGHLSLNVDRECRRSRDRRRAG